MRRLDLLNHWRSEGRTDERCALRVKELSERLEALGHNNGLLERRY